MTEITTFVEGVRRRLVVTSFHLLIQPAGLVATATVDWRTLGVAAHKKPVLLLSG